MSSIIFALFLFAVPRILLGIAWVCSFADKHQATWSWKPSGNGRGRRSSRHFLPRGYFLRRQIRGLF